MITIWVDDERTPKDGFLWAKSTNEAIRMIRECEEEIKA